MDGVVKCIKEHVGFTVGKYYEESKAGGLIDDDGDTRDALAKSVRSHHFQEVPPKVPVQCILADHKMKVECMDCGGCHIGKPAAKPQGIVRGSETGTIIPFDNTKGNDIVCVTKTPDNMVGVKFDDGKPDWSLLPLDAIEEVVKVMSFGAKKYTRDGWRAVPNAEDRYLAAMFRHIRAHRSGEEFDEESGLPHLAHAATCLVFLLELTT